VRPSRGSGISESVCDLYKTHHAGYGSSTIDLEQELLRLWKDPLLIHKKLNPTVARVECYGSSQRSADLVYIEHLRFSSAADNMADGYAESYVQSRIGEAVNSPKVFTPSPDDEREAISATKSVDQKEVLSRAPVRFLMMAGMLSLAVVLGLVIEFAT
jgi:hypothetical protein